MKIEIEYIPIEDIKPYERNAKKHPKEQIEQIKKSIEDYGFNDPIALWHGEIVEGHGRYFAAKELHFDRIPVMRLDHLTDDQRIAYGLVHNQLTMNSGFDTDLLSLEIESIPELDMDAYGFELPDMDEIDLGYYGDERERTNKAYNLDKVFSTELTDDFWQMPVIYNQDYMPDRLIGFNYAKTSTDKEVGIHFFIDDYQFERVWNYPDKYIDLLMQYDCILSPDFSLYSDMPMPMKIWNVYRSRQIGAYYQSCGIKVIPTISWAEEDTFCFCFEGIPKNSVVAVSTVGVKTSKDALRLFSTGMDAMIERIEPSKILIYGGDVDYDCGGIETVHFENEVTKAWRNGR